MKNWYLLCIRTCAFLCELILQTVRIWLITYAPMCAFTLEKCLYYLTEKKMNKAELIEAVASTTGLTKTDTKKTIDAVFEEITNSLKKVNQCSSLVLDLLKYQKERQEKAEPLVPERLLKLQLVRLLHFLQGKH